MPEPVDVRAEFEAQAGRQDAGQTGQFCDSGTRSSADRASAAVMRTCRASSICMRLAMAMRHSSASLPVPHLPRQVSSRMRSPMSPPDVVPAHSRVSGSHWPQQRVLPRDGRFRNGRPCLAAAAHAASPRADGGHIIATADTRRGSFFAQLFTAAADPLSGSSRLIPRITHRLPAHGTRDGDRCRCRPPRRGS